MSKDNKSNYKDSLNLPSTTFDMRAGLLKKEPAIQAKWRSEKLYHQIREARKSGTRFILHDGPPYANGNIHMGQALNKTLKDMVIKSKTMSGFDAPYVPGWDCHGLPIEAKVMDDLGPAGRELPASDIRLRCQSYADKFVRLQSGQFERLGIFGQFEDPYITMSPQYESAVLDVFAQLIEQDLVYRQLKPVHWSIENQTALADAELEHHDKKDPSIFVGFELNGPAAEKLPHTDGDKLALLVWTTTPWTLPANRAVAVHPDFVYCCVHMDTADGPQTVVVAEERLKSVLESVEKNREGWLTGCEVISKMTGKELIDLGLTYKHPLEPARACPVVPADYVTLEDGTGLVHTAPGHGIEDYETALKQDLEIYCPVKADGTLDETVPEFLQGLIVWQANPKVIEHLTETKQLVAKEIITHSYPHDWRSKTPTIFRATEQWFIAVDRKLAYDGKSLRQMALDYCGKDYSAGGVDFIPTWGQKRIAGMLESRPDWCISRQRSWGLPIPVFYNAQGDPLKTPASIRAISRTVAKEGADAWFAMTPVQLLGDYEPADDPDLTNPQDFPLDQLEAGMDIFDVWFESGCSWFAVAVKRGLVDDIPVDLYLEGSDQHRGWFQLSLLPALAAAGKPPYKAVLTHGFVVNEQGYKMSKSLGNTIDVIEQLKKRGADILRLWVASQNYQDDIRCSDSMIGQAEDAYRKIRNTLRFCMGSCFDFDPAKDAQESAEHSIDRWMKMELHRLIRDVRAAFDRYEFHKATRLIYEFCTVQASSIYLSAVKDRLYCESPNAIRRRATQTVIHEMLTSLTRLLAPILVHTCEEAWEHIPNRNSDWPHSVHLMDLPEFDESILEMADDFRPVTPDQLTFAPDKIQTGPAWIWSRLLQIRDAGMIKLEALRNSGVKNPLDTEAVITVASDNDTAAKFLETYLRELEDMLGVGYARIERDGQLEPDQPIGIEVFDTREKYERCARSWRRRPDVGTNADYPDLCARDAAVMKEISE